MKAILFNNYLNNLHGAVIDFIEYYICMLENKIDVKLLILNYNEDFKQKLFEIVEDRYVLEGIDYKKNIIGITLSYLIKQRFDRLLITDYGTIKKVKGLIAITNKKSKIIIMSDLFTNDPKHIINSSLYPPNSVVYYGEMPFVYKDIQYNHKFLFSRFKKLNKIEPNIFLHSPKNNHHDLIKNNSSIFKGKKYFLKTTNHKKNLFELFDTFVYYHPNDWFDARTRIMHECIYYNKKVYYFNEFNCIDGSYYRYKDLIENGLTNRYLNEHDEIIKEFG